MLRRCRSASCTMPSYLVQPSGFCSKCEQREDARRWAAPAYNQSRQASFQQPDFGKKGHTHEHKPSFNEGLSPAYKRHSQLAGVTQLPLPPPPAEPRPGLTAAYATNLSRTSRTPPLRDRGGHGLPGREQRAALPPPHGQPFLGLPQQHQPPYRGPTHSPLARAAAVARDVSYATRSPSPAARTPLLRASLSSHGSRVSRSEPRASSQSPYSLHARPSPVRSTQRRIYFAETAAPLTAPQGCQTPHCAAALYLIQANGFCTACNTKVCPPPSHHHFTFISLTPTCTCPVPT
jgi:hypothetical protein